MKRDTIHILLVEDNPADVYLATAALKEGSINKSISVVPDGEEAIDFLQKRGKYGAVPKPDLILLDINLPKLDGKEVLTLIKNDPELQAIPVIMLTTSSYQDDIFQSYFNHANCYITKPGEYEKYQETVNRIESFWTTIAVLPSEPENQ